MKRFIVFLFCLVISFGFISPVFAQYAVNYTISGVVFNDLNSNGVRDVGEPGVQNVTITIGALTRTTDVNGNYTFFQQFSAGTYSVVRTIPAGYIGTSLSPVSRTVGPDQTANFGIRPATYTISGNVFDDNGSGAGGVAGNGIKDGTEPGFPGVTIAIGAVNQTTNASGNYSFTGLSAGTYSVVRTLPAGYSGTTPSPVSRTVGPNQTANFGIRINPVSNTAVFCIMLSADAWFQTNLGDVRYSSLTNKIPSGKQGSLGSYPGIFFSSASNGTYGSGGEAAVSSNGWLVKNEYAYNIDSSNRNGTMSYSFYKSKASQSGVAIQSLTPGVFNQAEITGSGIYEADGSLTINDYTHISGRRVVILVKNTLTINDTSLLVPQGQGILIVAARGNITITNSIGTDILTDDAPQLDGYYTSEGDIIIQGGAVCPAKDKRLNIGGALIANAEKPFTTGGSGSVLLNRTLCDDNALYPALHVASRLDFLTQLTDFYKISYTKWKEEKP